MQFADTITIQIKNLLSLEKERISAKQTLLLVLIAYAFGAGCRLFYLFKALDNPTMLLDGFPMISTEDGYLFANYVKAVVNDFSLADSRFFKDISGRGLLVLLAWLGYVITPFTIEQVAVFLPVIFPPLVVLPLIYLGRLLGSTIWGFFAAVITVVGTSFLRRTSFSYFDTDFFVLTVPCLLILLGVYAILNPGLRAVLLLSLFVALTDWLDKVQVTGTLHLVIMLIYFMRNFKRPTLPLELILMASALAPDFRQYYERFLLVGVLGCVMFFLRRYYFLIDRRWWLGISLVYLGYVLWNNQLFGTIRFYTSYYGDAGRGVGGGGGNWNYYQVSGTIAEARTVNMEQLARETIGYTWMFLFGFVGAFFALARYPVLAVGGVLLGVGGFALQGGIRFVVYLIPIVAIGASFFILLIQRYVHRYVPRQYFSHYFSWLLAVVMLAVFLYPGVRLAYKNQPRFVAHPTQVQALQRLEKKGSPKDYVVSWWDYGYVMSYYSGMQNIINGAKHNEDNYIVSKAFSSTSQALAANLIRESVEAYEAGGRGKKATSILFGGRRPDFSPSTFVRSMASPDYVLQHNATRDIYLYVPYQMLRIYGVVRYFSDLSLESGRQQRAPLIVGNFYRVDREKNRIILPNSMTADLTTGELRQRGQVVGKINTIYNHQVKGQNSEMVAFPVSGIGNFFLILSPYYRIALVMGPEAFNANFIQMFFFNKYDKNYFELVERTPVTTIYRLKI